MNQEIYKLNLAVIYNWLFLHPLRSICALWGCKNGFFSNAFNRKSLVWSTPHTSYQRLSTLKDMPTLKRRVQHYINIQKKPWPPMLTDQQLEDLEQIVCSEFLLTERPHELIHYQTIDGICYPHKFKLTIDQLVKQFYANLPEPPVPKKRKRITSTPQPVFSSKKVA